jgi:DNA-binding HxlR family transcriptional regulator
MSSELTTRVDEDKPGPCPVVKTIDEIGSQWRLVVLHELQDGERRFNELKRQTDASARTLSRVLDDLQEMGFVDRRLEEDAPVASYYRLTEKGESLCPVFDALESWGEEWTLDQA